MAHARALELAKSGELNHLGPRGTPAELLQEAGISFSSMAENIAHAADILSAHYLLLTSPLHRHAILSPVFTQAGMGIAHRPGAHGSEIFVAQEFIQALPYTSADDLFTAINALINAERQKAGRPPLKFSQELKNEAERLLKNAVYPKDGGLPRLAKTQAARDIFITSGTDDIIKSVNILAGYQKFGLAVAKAPQNIYPGRFTVIILFKY